MPRILFLTFYYPPDLSAGSFRASALVRALQREAGSDLELDIITTLPNRYRSFQTVEAPVEEHDASLRIRRIDVPLHRSGIVDQARAFAYYAAGVVRLTRGQSYDAIVATSSRLMTATLASLISKRSDSRVYLDIRDIFAETMPALVPAYIDTALAPFVSLCENWTIRRADRVNLVSPGFKPWFERRYPGRAFSCFTNGVDAEFVCAQERDKVERYSGATATVVYAGNVGEGQGLHLIIPELARRLRGCVRFRIIGDGGRMESLRRATEGLDNVAVSAPMDRSALVAAYQEADVLFLHLNRYKPFLRVLPSKLFEYAAAGKPIWAGAEGFPAEFITSEIKNSAVFPPCDADAAMAALKELKLEPTDRREFVRRYDRDTIMGGMAGEVLSLARSGSRSP